MQTLGIEAYRDRYPSQLSGGQQQRVALARMLAVNPQVLLLDEPLSNLDAALRLEMRAELKRLHREFGTTIVFVTHDQWEAMTLATTIAVMSQGRLQQVGTPNEIYDRPANRFVAGFVGNPPINMIALDSGTPLAAEARAFLGARCPGVEPGAVGVRPEAITLAPPDAPAEGFAGPAEVAGILPTGEAGSSSSTRRAASSSSPRTGRRTSMPASAYASWCGPTRCTSSTATASAPRRPPRCSTNQNALRKGG